MVLEHNLTLVKKINRLLNWGHWFSFFNILLALVITASYWLAEPAPASILGWAYLLLNWLGHTAFICFLFFILTIFPLSLIFPYQRHIRGLAAVLATLGLVLLIFDAYVYNSLGYHIGSASYEQTLDLLRQQVVTNLRNFVVIVLLVSAILLSIELTISNFCWKKVERLKQSAFGRYLLAAFVGSFMLSHLLHIYADANLKWDVTKQDNVLPLSYPATAKTFLARYQLVDLSARAQLQLEKLSLPDTISAKKALQCDASLAAQPTLLLVSQTLSITQQQQLTELGLRPLEQHFAPRNTQEALLNLLYGQFMYNNSASVQFNEPPGWLSQLPSGLVSISKHSNTARPELPWLDTTTPASFAIVFDDDPQQHWQQYQQYDKVVVISLTADNQQFNLAPASVWVHWPALRQRTQHQVTQHLDWLPTLLTQAGCYAMGSWLGDNLLMPDPLPKLTISQQEIISFKKDKMVILRTDGSYGVWSAGTLVPLNEKLDIPMLTDALKRIQLPASESPN